MLATRCKCTSQRRNLMAIAHKMITECKSFDLHNKVLEPIPLTDIHFWEGVQTHTEDGNESLHIIQQSSCGINNTVPFSYMMNSIDELGNGLEIILTKYYSEAPDANPRYVSAKDFHINTNVNTYPRINQLCQFCWSDISNDPGHLDMMHPHVSAAQIGTLRRKNLSSTSKFTM